MSTPVSPQPAAPSGDSANGAAAPGALASTPTDRPELLAAGAFAGGFLFAMILRRFG